MSRCSLTRVTDVQGLFSSAAGSIQEPLSSKAGPFTTVRKNCGQETGLLTSRIPHGQWPRAGHMGKAHWPSTAQNTTLPDEPVMDAVC